MSHGSQLFLGDTHYNREVHHRKHPASTRRSRDVLWRFPKGPKVKPTQETTRDPQGPLRRPIQKLMILWKKMFLRSNSPCITYLFLFFTGRTNIQKFWTGTSTGRLRDLVGGRPWDQMMGRSKDVRGMSVKHVF